MNLDAWVMFGTVLTITVGIPMVDQTVTNPHHRQFAFLLVGAIALCGVFVLGWQVFDLTDLTDTEGTGQ